MRWFRIPGLGRLVRALRGLWPDGNPLRRGVDRAEAGVITTLQLAFLAGAPLAAMTAGRAVYDSASRAQHAQQEAWHRVPAVLLTPAQMPAYPPAEAKARWTAPDGSSRTGEVPAPAGATAGTTVTVWVDSSGRLTSQPLQHSQITEQTALAAIISPGILALALLAAGALAHWLLERRRLADWEAQWRLTGPQWTSHR